MTEPMPEARARRPNRRVTVVVAVLVLCGLAALCLAALGGGAVFLSQATAQARDTQTSSAAQAMATAAAQTSTVEAQVAADTATAAAKSARSTATAQALAQAATATALSNYAASTATAQARSDASTATAQAQAESSPTPVVAAPVAENWPLIVLDTFDANLHSWPTGAFSDTYGSGSRELNDGKYHWEASAKQSGRLWWMTYNDEKAADCYVAVDVSVVEGDANTRYGLVMRHDGKNYDFFDAGQNGQFGFYRWEGGQWTTLIRLTPSAAIDTSGVNRLAALVQGQQFTFYINDEQVATATESHLREGLTGMAVNLSQQTDKAVVEFDNFELRVP